MRRVFYTLLIILLFSVCAFAEEFTLSAGVSVNEVPKAFYGSWRVYANLEDTNSYRTFKAQSSDMWNLTRIGDKIVLDNPFTGANAEINVQTVEDNLIVFQKIAPYDNKTLVDTVTIRITGNTFTGINDLKLESYSYIDGHLMKTEHAKYRIK